MLNVKLRPPSFPRYLFKPGDTDIPGCEMFLFIDEHEDSIDDGFFLLGIPEVRKIGWENVPAARHNKACQLVFADGHADWRRFVKMKPWYNCNDRNVFFWY